MTSLKQVLVFGYIRQNLHSLPHDLIHLLCSWIELLDHWDQINVHNISIIAKKRVDFVTTIDKNNNKQYEWLKSCSYGGTNLNGLLFPMTSIFGTLSIKRPYIQSWSFFIKSGSIQIGIIETAKATKLFDRFKQKCSCNYTRCMVSNDIDYLGINDFVFHGYAYSNEHHCLYSKYSPTKPIRFINTLYKLKQVSMTLDLSGDQYGVLKYSFNGGKDVIAFDKINIDKEYKLAVSIDCMIGAMQSVGSEYIGLLV